MELDEKSFQLHHHLPLVLFADPPELPTLLGVKNGLATVKAGEIFKCKCVCYSGHPRASLVWLNHKNREVGALFGPACTAYTTDVVVLSNPLCSWTAQAINLAAFLLCRSSIIYICHLPQY